MQNILGYGVDMGGFFDGDKWQITLTYTIANLMTPAQAAQMDTAVASLLSSLDLQGKTSYGKSKAIYDWMCRNIVYDDTLQKHSAFNALVEKTSVCQGYASLFYRLALECGVDARVITGIGNGGPHAWNIVKLNGQYYNIDATWGASYYGTDPEAAAEWFLKSEADFNDHERDSQYKTVAFYTAYPMAASNYSESDIICSHTNQKTINEKEPTYVAPRLYR